MYVDKIKRTCQARNISIRDLAKEIGMSFSGLYASLNNNTLKVSALQDISKYLNVPITELIDENIYNTNGSLSDYYSNWIVALSINRYIKLFDKLNYLRDIFIGEVVFNIKFVQVPSYPFIIPGKPEKLLSNEESISLEIISDNRVGIPYSRLNDSEQGVFQKCDYLFEGFYFTIFYTNRFNINDYMSEILINDTELVKYWESWQKIKDNVSGVNWPTLKM